MYLKTRIQIVFICLMISNFKDLGMIILLSKIMHDNLGISSIIYYKNSQILILIMSHMI